MSSAGSVSYVGSFKLCCEILLLLNIDMDYLLCGKLWSGECHVHLVGVNRLSACRKFFGVHSLQNGRRCRDGVNVLWCLSHHVWLVLEGSIPTCACFPLENFFVACSCCFFLGLFLEMVRDKRGGKGEDCTLCKV